MLEKAEGLSADERKAYAEKVAMSFWSALGCSDDELDRLDDSDWLINIFLCKTSVGV